MSAVTERPIRVSDFIKDLDVEVFPITIIKFLLNRGKILECFNLVTKPDFKVADIETDDSDCVYCAKFDGKCRQHISINRILQPGKVAFDLDTNCYIYKNEVFRIVGDKIVIVYCPHPRNLKERTVYTDEIIRKVNPMTLRLSPGFEFPKFEVRNFLSSKMLLESYECWFNYGLNIQTVPAGRVASDWVLVLDPKKIKKDKA